MASMSEKSDMSIDQDPILNYISSIFDQVRGKIDDVGKEFRAERSINMSNKTGRRATSKRKSEKNLLSEMKLIDEYDEIIHHFLW